MKFLRLSKGNMVIFALQYTIAICLPIISLAVASIIRSYTDVPFATLIFFPSVILSAWYGGYKTGVVTTILSALALNYYSLSPYHSLSLVDMAGVTQLLLFISEGIIISVFIDIGKRKDRHLELRRETKELKARIALLEEENAASITKIRSRDEFLSIASHELKTPLTSMLLQTQHAIHNIRNVSLAHFSIDSLLKMLESVEHQSKRLSKMINDLLNVSLMTTGNLQLEPEIMNLNDVVKETIEDFKPRLEREQYILRLDEEDKITGYWDKVRVEQAITNLLSNAIKYGDKKPIEITIMKRFNIARVIIKDNGIGINKQIQKKIFELFARGNSPEKYKGLGVGLYITRQIAEAHGGSIQLKSSPSEGSTFIFQLPIKTPPKNSEREA